MRNATRARVLPRSLGGVPCEVLPLDSDVPFADLEVAHIKALGDGDTQREKDLADALAKRALDVAVKAQNDIRAHFGNPMGFTSDELGLDYNK